VSQFPSLLRHFEVDNLNSTRALSFVFSEEVKQAPNAAERYGYERFQKEIKFPQMNGLKTKDQQTDKK